MYGYIGLVGKGKIENLSANAFGRRDIATFIYEEEKNESSSFLRKTVAKFVDDKVWYISKNLIILLEGLIWNRLELCKKYGVDSTEALLIKLYQDKGERLVDDLNGAFALTVYDIQNSILYLYASHVAYRPLYYSIVDGQVLFATDIVWMYENLKKNGITLQGDMDGAISLLSIGYMVDETTIVSQVKKVPSGNYIRIKNGIAKRFTYWDIRLIKPSNDDYNTMLEKMESFFQRAISRLYSIDEYYGYKHVLTLSGGLDSRSIAFVADEQGYKHKFITFCQSGMNDAIISSQISADLFGEHMLYDLDNGLCYLDLDKAVRINGGLIMFQGCMPTQRLCELFFEENNGILHGGEIGDVLFGGSFNKYDKSEWSLEMGAYSSKYIGKLSQEFIAKAHQLYETGKQYAILNRGVNGCENGWLAANSVTESSSAFIDKELIEYMLSIPSKYTNNSKLYFDWIKKYHPRMCKYIWTSTSAKPGAPNIIGIINRAVRKIKYKVFRIQFNLQPFEYWYMENESKMRMYFDAQYDSCIEAISSSDLRIICSDLYQSGSIYEKMQVLSLIKSAKIFGIDFS